MPELLESAVAVVHPFSMGKMYETVLRLRRSLHWVLIAAAALTVFGVAFLSSLPFLIEGRAVRESFIRSLSEWSGGPVTFKGPLRVVSFTTLSIEASGVRFGAAPRLAPISRMDAKSVTAVARLSSLLRGKIEFKKVIVESPRFVFNRERIGLHTPVFGAETAELALAFIDKSPFERLELHHARFLWAHSARKPYGLSRVEEISLEKRPGQRTVSSGDGAEANGQVLSFSVADRGFEASFRGSFNRADENAQGRFSLTAPAQHPVTGKIVEAMAPWEKGHGISLTGDLSWSEGGAVLENATADFGDHGAKGSLGLALRKDRALLEGTLAYDTLELDAAGDGKGENGQVFLQPLRALAGARMTEDRNFDLDMRISAERFRAGPFEAEPLAVAISSREGHVSVDVAELSLFGGSVKGRVDYDPLRAPALNLDASGSRLDTALLTDVLGWPLNVSGRATVKLTLAIPFADERLSREAGAATGSFAISFPSGGTLDGDLARKLNSAIAPKNLFSPSDDSSVAFTAANIDGTAGPSGTSLRIDGESGGNRISGSFHIASLGNAVSGMVSLDQEVELPDPSSGSKPPVESSKPTNIVLSGTVKAPKFLREGKQALSN